MMCDGVYRSNKKEIGALSTYKDTMRVQMLTLNTVRSSKERGTTVVW